MSTKKLKDMSEEELRSMMADLLGLDASASLSVCLDRFNAVTAKMTGPQLVAVDEVVYNQLKADAADADHQLEAMAAERRDKIIDQAVKDGQIPYASRDGFRRQLDLDEEMGKKLIDGMQKGRYHNEGASTDEVRDRLRKQMNGEKK